MSGWVSEGEWGLRRLEWKGERAGRGGRVRGCAGQDPEASAPSPRPSPVSPPLVPSPLLAPSRAPPAPAGCPLPQALCISVGVRRDRGEGALAGERERGWAREHEGEGGAREGRWGRGEWALQSLPPPKRDGRRKHALTYSHSHTHTHTHHHHPHMHTHYGQPPTREEVIRTSTGEGTHRCSPASPRKSAEKQPSPLRIQPSSKDIVVEDASAQVSMKSAANCETSCDPQDLVNHRILERLTLRG